MPDVQWSNEPPPPAKTGLTTGAKVALGCGLLILASGGACAALLFTGTSKLVHTVSTAGDAEWVVIKKVTDQLATEEGAKAAWVANPGLQQSFGSEDEFLKQAALMRPLLEPVPQERPSIWSGRLTISSHQVGDDNRVVIGYRTLGGSLVTYSFENNLLTNLRLERTLQGPSLLLTVDAGPS